MSRQQLASWDVTLPSRSEAAAGAPPRLSVMITYYKGEDVVADAVRSVLAQTLPAHEIVICDDGSPDDIDAGLGDLREHVRIVRKENGGTGSALNAAARAATGDYVVQLDVDDVFEPRRLEAIAAVVAERPDVDMICSDAVIEYEGGALCALSEIDPYPEADEREAMLRTCTVLWPAVRRSLVLDAGGWDEGLKAIEDWDCWLRLVLDGAVVAFIHEPLYRWRLTAGSRSSSNRVAHFSDQVRLTEKALQSSPLNDSERRLASSLLDARRRGLAREEARRAVEEGNPDARRLSLRLITGSGFDGVTRAKAGIAVVSPLLAARFIGRRREAGDPVMLELSQRGFRLPDPAALAAKGEPAPR